MTPQSDEAKRTALKDALSIRDEDLAANHQGQLGPGQNERLRKRAILLNARLLFAVCLVFVVPVWVPNQPLEMMLFGFFAAGLYIAVVLSQVLPIRRDIRAGTVMLLHGTLRREGMKPGFREIRKYDPLDRWTDRLSINNEDFYVPNRLFGAVTHEAQAIVYYLPQSRIIVAIEQAPANS